jgi:hypothetical protein
MHDPAAASPVAEQTQLIQRILASKAFRKSHRLSAFLRYIFERYSKGQVSQINEARIGTEVFGRPPGYHVGEDSIVRSQARFLRQRLEEYFTTEGAHEPLVLRIPKGSYVPVFEARAVAAVSVVSANPSLSLPPPTSVTPVEAMSRSQDRGLRQLRVAVLVAMLAAVLVSGWFYRVRVRQQSQIEPPVVKAFWASIFNPARTTLIVPADSTLVLIEEITGKPVHLTAYIDRSYLNIRPTDSIPLWDMLAGSEYTSTADLNLVAHLQRIPQAIEVAPEIRYARDLSLKDLKQRNAILIGGLRANPWMELFSSSTNFDVDYDVEQHRNVVRNRAPSRGELPLYIEEHRRAGAARAYGVVVYLPSLDNQGQALLVEGTSKAGTEAAAEFLTSPEFARFLRMIDPESGAVPSFEVLLSTDIMDGASYHPLLVCWHALHKGPNS